MKFLTVILSVCLAFSCAKAQDWDVSVAVEGGTLHGSMVVPEGGGKVPVVLFISGSGPTDRDGGKASPLKMMSRELLKAGIASVRYDKRLGFPAEHEVTFKHYVDDAGAWVDMLAAERQRQHGILDRAYAIIDTLATWKTVAEVPQELISLFRPSVQPYYLSHADYAPTRIITEAEVPILMIHGTTDIQVPPAGARELAALNPRVRAVVIDVMSHPLKKTASTDRAKQLATVYALPVLPLHEELMPLIISFIRE